MAGCWNCDDEGYVYGCSWDWQCDTWDGDSCLCSRRCDVCNPSPRNAELDAVLAQALADDETCTDCYGTGYNGNREARCHCTPEPDRPKVDQTVEGIGNPRGNCLQAAVATVTGLPLPLVIDVTAPGIDPDFWHVAMAEWGDANGFEIASQRELPSEEYCVAVGPTERRNGLHAVAYRNGELYHDPHSSRDGLTSVRYYLRTSPRSEGAGE